MENITMMIDDIIQLTSGMEVQLRKNNGFDCTDDRLIIANWTDERLPVIGDEYLVKLIFYSCHFDMSENANTRS